MKKKLMWEAKWICDLQVQLAMTSQPQTHQKDKVSMGKEHL